MCSVDVCLTSDRQADSTKYVKGNKFTIDLVLLNFRTFNLYLYCALS